MVDQPAAPAPFVIGPDGAPIILSELRWPFEELGARDVPRELPIARPDVQLTVSMLAAMRDGVPSLVQVDAAQDDQVRVQVDNSNELLAFVTCLITLVKAVEEVVVFSNPGQEPSVTVIETGPTRVYDLRGFSGPGPGVAPSLVFAPN